MKRHLMQQLLDWQVRPDRKPLIIHGVRQTGKTYLLEAFGKQAFRRYHLINFEKQVGVNKIFAQDLLPHRIIDELQFFLKTAIDVQHDLVIFDEIQACPAALTSLKYFCEDMPELALCSAGSLLGLRLSEGSYPVGKVDLLHLYAMTFSEFLLGLDDHQLAEILLNSTPNTVLPEMAHERLWERLKHYFITGGLPEVISTFAKFDNLFAATHAVRMKQDELINGYFADIAKHSGKVNSMHIDRVWRSIPQQLAQTLDGHTPKFAFKHILPGIKRYAQLVNVIDWLQAAELIIKVPILDRIQQPLNACIMENRFKLLMFDVGILGALNNLDPKTILDYDYGSYKGYFAENFVAQQLLSQNQKLFCWQEDRSEVEFVLQYYSNIIPIEVKSGIKTRTKSLQKFIKRYQPPYSFILSAKNYHADSAEALATVNRVPLYFAEKILPKMI